MARDEATGEQRHATENEAEWPTTPQKPNAKYKDAKREGRYNTQMKQCEATREKQTEGRTPTKQA